MINVIKIYFNNVVMHMFIIITLSNEEESLLNFLHLNYFYILFICTISFLI